MYVHVNQIQRRGQYVRNGTKGRESLPALYLIADTTSSLTRNKWIHISYSTLCSSSLFCTFVLSDFEM